ncbi:MAG: hypothetical protein PHT94_02260 [Candidatus Nanoarchaeia archaeon]|nr:hypothetical protein [Candidatus Nanoarchaeia archaeon]
MNKDNINKINIIKNLKNQFKLFFIVFLLLSFISCDNIFENKKNNTEYEVEKRIIEYPIDVELELKNNNQELSYLDNLNLFVNLKNNAKKNLLISYQIGYNYLELEEGENNGKIDLEENQKEFFNYYFSVLPLDYNLEYIDLNYYYCYNYDYNYDLYIEMYDDNGKFLEDNSVSKNLNDMISNVIVDKVDVRNRNNQYFIEIYFKKNIDLNSKIVKSVDYKSCSYNYDEKDIVEYLVKINDQDVACNFNIIDEGSFFSFLYNENPKIICEYKNENKVSLNLDLNLKYGYLGEIKNRLGVKFD